MSESPESARPSRAISLPGTVAIGALTALQARVNGSLGTALGDFLADSSGLGFGGGALLIGSLLAAIVLVIHRGDIVATLKAPVQRESAFAEGAGDAPEPDARELANARQGE